mgnify:CR=1 FL=1
MAGAGRQLLLGALALGLAACGGQERSDSGPPQPLDTRPQPLPVADPTQPVASGNTRAAAEIAALAALRADFDPQREAEADLATAQVEARRGNRRIILELGEGGCGPCQALAAAIEGQAELRRLRDAGFVWVRVDRSGPANAGLLQRLPGGVDAPAPQLLLLDEQGQVLQAQAGADLVPEGRPDHKRIRALLEQWAPATPPPAP